jgi:uncharacterized protein
MHRASMTGDARIQYVSAMKFTPDRPATLHVIRAYGPGALRIGDRTFDRSVIVSAESLVEGWRPASITDLRPVDLEPLLALEPEVTLIGSGSRQAFPDRSTLQALYAARIGFEIMDTGAACRTYNVLVAEGRRVAAALIVEPLP